MSDVPAPAPAPDAIDDVTVERAILALLAERSEIYPAQLAGELRRRVPTLATERVPVVLDRLWRERRVARLWHRYLLPDRVDAVRARWLAAVEQRRDARDRIDPAYAAGHALLCAWDGWRGDQRTA